MISELAAPRTPIAQGNGMVRLAMIALICAVAAVGSFYATSALLDGRSSGWLGSAPLYRVDARKAVWGWYPGMTVTKAENGMQIVTRFQNTAQPGDTEGMIYHDLNGQAGFRAPNRRIRVELDAVAAAVARQNIQMRFVQVGLKDSGWQSYPAKEGANTYTLRYEMAPDARKTVPLCQVWLRSDADGAGRPLVIQELRIFPD